jgi:redox-sensing transcriptional repressor
VVAFSAHFEAMRLLRVSSSVVRFPQMVLQGCSSVQSSQAVRISMADSKQTQAPTTHAAAKAPAAAVGRMSLYLRELQRLSEAGVQSTSSRDLAQRLNVSPEVVRRDLAILGSVGRRGVGYEVNMLAERLRATLGSDTQWRVVLVGTGSLGHALLRYRGFERLGFELVAALDIDPKRIGEKIADITIADASRMAEIFRELRPQLAILAVPAEVAAEMATRIVASGVTGILNFAPTSLKLPKEIGVVNVDLASEMQRLAFNVSQKVRFPNETQ